MNKRYRILKQLGKGTYAIVYQAYDEKEKEIIAIKCIELEPLSGIPATTLREISILKTLNHPNILKYKTSLILETQIHLITEYIEYELSIFLNKYKYNTEDIFNQLVSGLNYLHSKGVIHRDLKPQNILVNKYGIIKIADFGLSVSTKIKMKMYSNDVVTLWYRSPELLNGIKNYSYEVDMWSFGCIMLEIFLGEPFFMGKNEKEMIKLIEEFEYSIKEWQQILEDINIPEYLSWSVFMCLKRDRKERITSDFLKREYVKK